jgi:hypothetical protein
VLAGTPYVIHPFARKTARTFEIRLDPYVGFSAATAESIKPAITTIFSTRLHAARNHKNKKALDG